MLEIPVENEKNKRDELNRSLSAQAMQKTIGRILSYSGIRILSVLFTVGLGLYLTLLIINLGGYVDEIMEGQIAERILGMGMSGAFDDIPPEDREVHIDEIRWQMQESMGLHEPLTIRTARWWFRGITLQWGVAERLESMDQQSRQVKDVIFSRLPFTLLLVGAANVILFFVSLWTAMKLSNQRGKFWDRLLSSLTPISSAPSWVIGVILLAVFALELRILPFKGLFDGMPPENPFQYILQLSKHMVLPVTAIILSVFFQGVYTWRTFFMVHSGEDYVELAKAKGLPDRVIRKQYLLRPTLPSVITSFAMMLISFWESSIALELLFQWPGLGAIFYRAIYAFDRPVVVAIVVLFAYLLGLSVIMLDVVYALIDPRVRVGGNGPTMKDRAVKHQRFFPRMKNYFHKRVSARSQKALGERIKSFDEDEITKPIRVAASDEYQQASTAAEVTRRVYLRDVNQDITKPVFIPRRSGRRHKIQGDDKIEAVTRPVVLEKKRSSFLKSIFQPIRINIFKNPMAVIGILIIFFLFVVAVGTVIAIPYEEAVAYWHSEGSSLAPRLARPVWTNLFRREKWPESIYFDSTEETKGVASFKEKVMINEEMDDTRMTFEFDFTADDFPQDLIVSFNTTYNEKAPFASLIMTTPDGREIEIKNFKATSGMGFYLSHEDQGYTRSNEPSSVQKIFGDPATEFEKTLKGTYIFEVLVITFEEDSEVDFSGVMHGKVFGLFGTDTARRDLTIAMLWGTPVALTFGIIGALVTTTTTILLAAVSSWYGGWVDEVLQRITEINIILPALPIAILVFILYSKSIWVILAIMILMNIFGNSLKEYRAMFMQFKELPYIEAARAYGASDGRIILKYMLPRIIQVTVPQLVISVPSFVFLEATLAYLGVAAPYLPTWGKVINMALHQGTFWGHYFWVLEPIALVLLTGLAFAFVGFALDKILNPRLRNR